MMTIEKIIEQRFARESECHDRRFGHDKQEETRSSRYTVGEAATGKIAHAKSGHERSDNEGYRINIAAGEKNEEPLPDDLIQKSRETGGKKNDERDPSLARAHRSEERRVGK